MNIRKTAALAATAGLLTLTITGCSLFPKKDPQNSPEYSSDTLPPVLGVGSVQADASKRKRCSESELASLFASIDPALGEQLARRIYFFGTDSSELSAAYTGSLDAHAALLAKVPAKVQVSGHTDERGTHDYNLALGERRANALARYLVSHGVPSERLAVVSYGKEEPVAEGHDEAAWSQNRRVELEYTECKLAK